MCVVGIVSVIDVVSVTDVVLVADVTRVAGVMRVASVVRVAGRRRLNLMCGCDYMRVTELLTRTLCEGGSGPTCTDCERRSRLPIEINTMH